MFSTIRDSDTAARLGGDEFAVLLPYAGRAEAAIAAERVQAALARPVRLEDTLIDVAASIGVAVFPQDAESYDALFAAADAAMYAEKERRRADRSR